MKRVWDWLEFVLVVMFVLSCHLTKKTAAPQAAFDKQGHRGSRGLMPENTIPAMIRAIDLGVTTLEMDAVITSDKKVILSHETHYNPETTTIDGGSFIDKKDQDKYIIYQMSYQETTRFDVGLRPYAAFPKQQRVKAIKPLLSDVIDSVERYVRLKNLPLVHYNIETKIKPSGDNKEHPSPEEFVDLLIGVVNAKNISKRVIIQSFDFRTLQVMHKKYPEIRLAALVSNTKSVAENTQTLGFIPAIYSPAYMLVNAAMIEQCHQMKMKIIPWTVNDKAKIDSLKQMGADGIISDFPDLF